MIWNLRVNIKNRETPDNHFCLPEIQSAKLCMRLQFACHIRTSPELEWTTGPDAMISTDKVQKRIESGLSDETVPSWWGSPNPTGSAEASENLSSFLQKKTKKNKTKIDTQCLKSLGIRRAAARTDRRSHASTSKSLSIRRHAQPGLIWLSCSKLPGQERKQRRCPSTIIVNLRCWQW